MVCASGLSAATGAGTVRIPNPLNVALMSSRTIFLCLFIIGVLFLLANFGIIQIHYVGPIIARWWPALLVFFGVMGLMSKR